nr:unnamed protein product [Callosobruchus analis]
MIIVTIPSFHDKIEVASNTDSNQNVYFPERTIHIVDTPKTTTQNGSISAPRKILGPKRNRTNRSAPLKRSALDYLQNKEIKEESLKTRQLDLEQERMNIEKRRLILDEQR